ncbi:hypothetical protein E1A91_D11G110500v1, partial [Gossypium mustelinum]
VRSSVSVTSELQDNSTEKLAPVAVKQFIFQIVRHNAVDIEQSCLIFFLAPRKLLIFIFFLLFLHFNLLFKAAFLLDLLAFIPSRSAPLPIGKAVLGQRPSDPFSSSRRLVQIHFFSSSFFAFNC